LEKLQVDHYTTQSEIIDKLLLEDELLRNEVYSYIQNSNFYDRRYTPEQNRKKGMIQGMVFGKVKQNKPALFEEMDKQFENQEKNLKAQLRALGWDR
jgi:hypothetical protein